MTTHKQMSAGASQGEPDPWIRLHFVIKGPFDHNTITEQVGLVPDHVAVPEVVACVQERGSEYYGTWMLSEPKDPEDPAPALSVSAHNLLNRMKPSKQAILRVIRQEHYRAQFDVELGLTDGICPQDTTILAADLLEIAEYGVDIEIYPY